MVWSGACGAGAQPPKALAPPDIEGAGAAGVCLRSEGGGAVVSLGVDTPTPRCIIVRGGQRLTVVNKLSRPVTVLLGGKGFQVAAAGESTFPLRFEQYLAPGAHSAKTDAYPGGGGFEVRLEQ